MFTTIPGRQKLFSGRLSMRREINLLRPWAYSGCNAMTPAGEGPASSEILQYLHRATQRRREKLRQAE